MRLGLHDEQQLAYLNCSGFSDRQRYGRCILLERSKWAVTEVEEQENYEIVLAVDVSFLGM